MMNLTSDARHWAGLLQVAKEHLLLVEHLSWLMLGLLWVDEDRPEEVGRSISNPHPLNPATRNMRYPFIEAHYNCALTRRSTLPQRNFSDTFRLCYTSPAHSVAH